MVVGDGRPFVGALITLDDEFLSRWAAGHGKPAGLDGGDAARDPELLAEVQLAVDEGTRRSRRRSRWKFRILRCEFTEEAGRIAPSMKLKRNMVAKDFADGIEAIYTA